MAPRWSSGLRFEIGELTLIALEVSEHDHVVSPPLDAAPLAAGGDRAADVGRAGRQRVPSLAVALLAVARFAPPLVLGAALPAPSVTCLHVSSSKERRGSASG